MSKKSDNDGVFGVYLVGLLITAICVGILTEAVYGWLTGGLGLLSIAVFAFVFNGLEDIIKLKHKED